MASAGSSAPDMLGRADATQRRIHLPMHTGFPAPQLQFPAQAVHDAGIAATMHMHADQDASEAASAGLAAGSMMQMHHQAQMHAHMHAPSALFRSRAASVNASELTNAARAAAAQRTQSEQPHMHRRLSRNNLNFEKPPLCPPMHHAAPLLPAPVSAHMPAPFSMHHRHESSDAYAVPSIRKQPRSRPESAMLWTGYSVDPQPPFLAHDSRTERMPAPMPTDAALALPETFVQYPNPPKKAANALDILSQTAFIFSNSDPATTPLALQTAASAPNDSHPVQSTLANPPWGALSARQIMHLQACYSAYDGIPPQPTVDWTASILGLDPSAVNAWFQARAAITSTDQHANASASTSQSQQGTADQDVQSQSAHPSVAAASPSQLLEWGLVDNNAALDQDDHNQRLMEIEVSSAFRRKRNSMLLMLGGGKDDGEGTAFILPLPSSPRLSPSMR